MSKLPILHDGVVILFWFSLYARTVFCAVLVQISIKISSRRYAEEGLGTTQMCFVGAIKAEGPFVCSRLLVFHLEA